MLNKCLTIMIVVVALCGMATMTTAMAGGNFPWTKNKQLAPNVTSIAPAKDDAGVLQSGCVSTVLTKGAVQGKYSSVDGYVSHEAEVYTIYSSMATQRPRPTPAVVDWKLDGTPIAVGSSFKVSNSGANTFKRVTQEIYSGVKRTVRSCTRRQ